MDKNQVNRVLNDDATEQEAVQTAIWLGGAEGQLDVSDRIDADMEDMVPYYDSPARHAHMPIRKNKSVWWYVASAVVLVLMLAGGTVMWHKQMQADIKMQTICANRGEQIHVVLSDGTHIYLNAGSRLVFPNRFMADTRTVTLVGEAYFQVEKDPQHPFVVDLNGVSVEVLGTQFDVRAYENEMLKVSLDEGHVVFHGAKQTVDMQPGEQLCYDRLTCQSVLHRHTNTLTASAWKEHRLEVDEMPMQELKTLLERNYDVDINIRDAKCLDYTYSLVVNDRDLENVLQRMSAVSPIAYRWDKEKGYVVIFAKR